MRNIKHFHCFQVVVAAFLRLKIIIISRNGIGDHGKNQIFYVEGIKKAVPEYYGKSDEETVWEIQENPYLQYFLGYQAYSDKKPFDPSMFSHFRLRFGLTGTQKVNDIIGCMIKMDIGQTSQAKEESGKGHDDDSPGNSGKLILDATCAPADITFPTDLKVLNDARVKSEAIIDDLHEPLKGTEKKPRTWRKNARGDFLWAAKAKRLSEKKGERPFGNNWGILAAIFEVSRNCLKKYRWSV